jgi:hypothetical protein
VDGECHAPAGTLLWQQRIDGRFWDYSAGVASDSHGNAVIAFLMTEAPPERHFRGHVRKLGLRGELLWEDVLDASSSAIEAITVDRNDVTYVVGEMNDGVASSYLRVIDPGGQLIGQKTWPADELRTADDVAVDEAGNIWISGSVGKDEARPLAIRKLDAARNTLWARTYRIGQDVWRRFSIDVDSHGNAMIVGTVRTEPVQAWFARLDPAGEELWSTTFAGADATGAVRVTRGPDDELWSLGYDYMHPWWLRSYSAQGDSIAQPSLPGEPLGPQDLAVAPDRRSYLGGSSYRPGHKIGAWITELLSDGKPGWQFLDPPDTYPFDRSIHYVALTPQGDLLVIGDITLPGNRGVWVARFAGANGGTPNAGDRSSEALIPNSFPDHDGSPVFTDPLVPTCEPGNFSHWTVTGTLGGAAFSIDLSWVPSQLNPTSLELPAVIDGAIRNDLVLKWAQTIVEGQGTPLTGGKLWLPEDQPMGGQFLCITQGDLGALPAVYYSEGDGRPFRFRITGARLGEDCTGPQVNVALYSCLYRTSSYIP